MKGKKVMIFVLSLLIMGMAIDGSTAQTYVIGDEDVLQISVWGNPDLSVQVPVRPDGMISAPLIGDVKAAGLTPQELKMVLEKELAKFMKTPTVSVIVTAVNSFKVYILGEGIGGGSASGTTGTPGGSAATASGVVTLRRNTDLLQLLAHLGSLRDADLNNSYILRNGKRLSNDFFKLIAKGDQSQNVELKPNDVIFVPDNFEQRIRVVGAVRTPGIIQCREGMTALDAILIAGGFTEFAKQNDVVVIRKEAGEMKSIEARLKDVIKDGDISKDVRLKPGDHVIVKTGIF
jgi:polysaccharide export outer membrane protein